jgi:hypothetical protein
MCEHLTAQAAIGDFRGFSCLFDALEEALKEQSTELYDELTSGLLNTLVHTCERKGIDLGLVAERITGPMARKEWNASYRWTHRGGRAPVAVVAQHGAADQRPVLWCERTDDDGREIIHRFSAHS